MFTYLPKLNKLYSLICEDNKMFKYNDTIQLPSKYLTIDSIKQCIISKHLIRQIAWRDEKLFNRQLSHEIIETYIFKNIQLALEYIFNNKQLIQKNNK